MSEQLTKTSSMKLSLNLKELRPKYDLILPQIFQALEHVKDPEARSQFECLLSDVYETFFQPEVEQNNAKKPTMFLEIIQEFMQDPSHNKKTQLLQSFKLRQVHLTAAKKLEQAKSIQKQIERIDDYFEGILSTLPELEYENISSSEKTVKKSRSSNTWTKTKTHNICRDANLNKVDTATKATAFSQEETLHTSCTFTSKEDQNFYFDEVADREISISRPNATLDTGHSNHISLVVDNYVQKEIRSSPAGSIKSHRSSDAKAPIKLKLVLEKPIDIQLHVPPLSKRESETLMTKTKSCLGGVVRQNCITEDFCSSESNMERMLSNSTVSGYSTLFDDYMDRPSSVMLKKEALDEGNLGDCACRFAPDSTIVVGCDRGDNKAQGSLCISVASSFSGDGNVLANENLFSMNNLVERVESMGLSLQERRIRIKAMKKSNSILSERIAEVESTLKSFDNYMASLKKKPFPAPQEALKREMYAFQETMMEQIFSSLEVVNEQMTALRKTEQAKVDKVKAMFAKYEAIKKESAGDDGKRSPASPRVCRSPVRAADREFSQGLQAVVKGIEFFHASCGDIWDDTMDRLLSDLDRLFMSLPSSLSTRWTPDDPGSGISLSLSSMEILEEEVKGLAILPEDKSKYGKIIVLSLRVLERVSREFIHLMVATRIKDLQIISIDHNLGLAYISLKRMIGFGTVKMPSLSVKSSKRKKTWKSCQTHIKHRKSFTSTNEIKPVAESVKTKERKLTPSELVPLERKLQKHLNTDMNLDKRMLKRRMFETQEGDDAGADTSTANKKVLAGQIQINNAQHMGSAADMRLPLIQSQDSNLGGNLSTASLDGPSPWTQIKNTEKPGCSPVQPKETQTCAAVKKTPKPKAISQKVPHLVKKKSKSVTADGPKIKFIQETAVWLNENGQPVNCMGNVEDLNIHRPIQYCRTFTMPTPPSTIKIKGESKLVGKESNKGGTPKSMFN